MEQFCKEPCKECPFRVNSLPGWLGGFTPEETQAAAHSEDTFHCHLTRRTNNKKHCAGRLLYASNAGKMFRNQKLDAFRIEVKKLNPNFRTEILTPKTFITHHSQFNQ